MKRVLQAIRPRLYVEEPVQPLRRWLFRLVQEKQFDNAIMACIVVNTLFMCLEHDGQSSTYAPCAAVPSLRVTSALAVDVTRTVVPMLCQRCHPSCRRLHAHAWLVRTHCTPSDCRILTLASTMPFHVYGGSSLPL